MNHVKKFPLHGMLVSSLSAAASKLRSDPNTLIAIGSTILLSLMRASDLPEGFWESLPEHLAVGLEDERAERALVFVIRRVVDNFGPEDTTTDHELVARLREIALIFDPSGEVRLPPKGGDPSFD